MADVNLEFNKLLKNIQKLEPKLNKSIVNLGVKAGAKTVQQAAKSNVPSSLDDGKHSPSKVHSADDLKDSIKIKKKTINQNAKEGDGRNITSYQIGIDKVGGKAWFAHFIEFGSKLHIPHPFMTPAFEQNGQQALKASQLYMKKRFDTAVKKGLVK